MNWLRTTSLVRGTLNLQTITHSRLKEAASIQWTRSAQTSKEFSTDHFSSSEIVSSTDSQSSEEKPIFPDPADPMANPLAPLSAESQLQRINTWQGEKPGPAIRIYESKVEENGVARAKGGRKRSFARVWLREGSGVVTVNGRSWVDYFPRVDQRDKILRPMSLLGMVGQFDVFCSVNGGGHTGQAEAIRFSLSRAMQNWEPTWRSTLKKEGLLTRDSRIVEPKKYGRKKARKSFQWVKR